MDENRKKRIYIIGGVVVLILVGIVLFFMLRGNDGTNPLKTFFSNIFGSTPPDIGTPLGTNIATTTQHAPLSLENQKVFRITDEPAIGATLSLDGKKILYFKKARGNLFENTFEGIAENRLSNITIPSLQDVQWTQSKSYAVLGFFAEGTLRRAYVHISSTSTVTSGFLPENISALAVSHTEDKIAYAVVTGEGASLFTATPDNTKPQKIYTSELTNIELAWPKTNTIAIALKGSAYAPSHAFTLTTGTDELTPLISKKEGLDTVWSPTGEHVLYTETATQGRVVRFNSLSLAKKTITSIPFTTLPEKCAWAPDPKEQVLYCGIPKATPTNTRLPDDWWQGSVSSNDELWKINLDTQERKLILPLSDVDAVNLFLSPDEDYLFFINKKDGFLWSIRLEKESS